MTVGLGEPEIRPPGTEQAQRHMSVAISAARALQTEVTTELVIKAGRALHEALCEVIHDRKLWARLSTSEHRLGDLSLYQIMHLEDLVGYNIPRVLAALGYREPPPSAAWTHLVNTALHEAIYAEKQPAEHVGHAKLGLIFFAYRLDGLLKNMEGRAGEEVEARRRILGPSLRTMVKKGVRLMVIASVAAGAAFGIVDGFSFSGVAHEVGKEAVKVGIETAALYSFMIEKPAHGLGCTPAEKVFVHLATAGHAAKSLSLGETGREDAEALRFVFEIGLAEARRAACDVFSTVEQQVFNARCMRLLSDVESGTEWSVVEQQLTQVVEEAIEWRRAAGVAR